MRNLTLREKLQLLIRSSKEYSMILLIGFIFIATGSLLITFGWYENMIYLIVFGSIFIGLSLFFIGYTIPSSISYYYNKALAKKYGKYTEAQLTAKEIIDLSYTDNDQYNPETKKYGVRVIEESFLLTYTFSYAGKMYENQDDVDQEVYHKLELGAAIPIQFIATNPEKAYIRKRKLKRALN